jgi:phage gp29-like protein
MGFWTRLFGAAPAPTQPTSRDVTPSKDDVVAKSQLFSEPSIRAYPTWTPQTVRSAELAADGGNMRLAGDLCEWLLKDERISSNLSTRVESILGSEISFQASGDGRRKGRAVKALQAEEDWFDILPEDETEQVLRWSILLGISPAQKVWRKKGSRVIPVLKFWFPRHLTFRWEERRWYIRVDSRQAEWPIAGQAAAEYQTAGLGNYNDIPISNQDRYWCLLTPFGASRPWAHGKWREISRWAILKDCAIHDFGLHSEVHGQPIKKIELAKGTDPTKILASWSKLRKDLSEDLRQLARNAVFAVPPGFDFSLVEATAKTWEMFQAQVAMADTAISVCILGQNMTTEGKANQQGVTGAREVRQDILESDERRTTTFCREQVLCDWAELNYADRELAPWPHWGVEQKEDLKSTAATWLTLAQAKDTFRKNEADLDNDEIKERFDCPIVEFEPPPPPPLPMLPGVPPEPAKEGGMGADGVPVPGEPAPPPASGKGKEPGKPPPAPASTKAAKGSAGINLEGAAAPDPDIDNGQRYADRVAESAIDAGTRLLAPTVAAMLSAVNGATSYAEALQAVKDKYSGLRTPAELVRLTEAVYVMTELGGQLSAVEHVESDE